VRPSRRSLTHIAARLDLPITALLREGGPTADARVAELERLCEARHYAEALDRAQAMLRANSPMSGRLVAAANHHAGVALHHLGRPQEAIERLRLAQTHALALPDPWLVAESLDWEAAATHVINDTRALDLGREALRRYRLLHPRRPEVEARMLEHLGGYWSRQGAHHRAEASYHEALHMVGAVRDLGSMGRIYHGLAICAYQTGDLRRSIELMRKAVAFYSTEQELQPDGTRTLSLPKAENDMAMLLTEVGQLEQADELLQSALSHFAVAGMDQFRVHVLHSISSLRQRQGRIDEAFDYARDTVALAASLGLPVPGAEGLKQLGELYAACGRDDEADASYARAMELLRAAELPDQVAECEKAYQQLRRRRVAGQPPSA